MKISTKLYRYHDYGPGEFPIPTVDKSVDFERLKELLAQSAYRCVFVIDERDVLLGFVTQGDFLRHDLSGSENSVMALIENHSNFFHALNASSAHDLISERDVNVVPIKAVDGRLEGAVVREFEHSSSERSQGTGFRKIALIVSGGKGTRLGEITKEVPKPLIKVAEKPLIEYVMASLAYIGCQEFHLLCGHLPEAFKEFAHSSKFNVELNFEDRPLNTGGPLLKWVHDRRDYVSQMVKGDQYVTLLIANGDLLFDVDHSVLDRFNTSDSQIAIIGRTIETHIKYGTMVVDENQKLARFVEKPTVEHLVNTGVYLVKLDKVLLNALLEFGTQSIGMPQLLEDCAKKLNQNILVITVKGNYLDLGTPDDLKKLRTLLEG